MDSLRPDGALRWKVETMVGKVGKWYVKRWHLQGCSRRLCRLRTDELALVSKYWTYRSHVGDMGPVSLVACCQQMFSFRHCFIGWLRRETWYRPPDRLASVLCPTQLTTHERLVYVNHVRYIWFRARRGPSVEGMSCVGRVFPYKVYINSNCRDSRIWVTAYSWQSSRRKLME
jgi:hypothetical protein